MFKLIFVLIYIFVGLNAVADECKPLNHDDGKRHAIYAMKNEYTHIILPENILEGTKPIVGNNDLWSVDHAGPHIYVKSKSDHKLGSSTSISVVGVSKKSYDFKITRHKSKSGCYRLVNGEIFSPSERSSIRKQVRAPSDDLAMLWREKYNDSKQSHTNDVRRAVLDALRRYRYQIYTRYDWDKSKRKSSYKKGTKGFIGNNFVADVYDDGRFTYIRVHNQNKGLMIIEAVLEGRTEIIEAKYDPINMMYTVSGIFPEFKLKYGKSKVKISRADNSTVGEY